MSNALISDSNQIQAPKTGLWNRLSLRTRFFAAAAIALAATVLLVVVFQSILTSQQQRNRLETYELPAQLQSVAGRIQSQLNLAIAGSEALANNTFIHAWIAAGRPADQQPAIEAAMAQVQKSQKAVVVSFTVSTPDGPQYYHYSDGHFATRTLQASEAKDSWYFNFIKKQAPYELNLDVDSIGNKLLMFINYRGIPNAADGKSPLMVAGGGMGMNQLSELIRSNKVGESGSVMLVRSNGVVDVHINPALAGKLDLSKEDTYAALVDQDWKLVRDKGSAVVESQTNGVPVYLAAMYLPDLNRYLVAELPAAELTQSVAHARWYALAAGMVLLMVGLAILYPLSGQLLRPLLSLQQQMAEITDSLNLNTQLRSIDQAEIGSICSQLNRFLERLRVVVGGVNDSTDSIHTRSSTIAHGNRELSGRTEAQAAMLEQAGQSMQQLTSSVEQNAQSANQASALSADASDIATQGGELMAQVVENMRSIAQSSERITDIISVIDSIAFQTNILALNAAVEAARAGEQGRGFAVVATEVRGLAQRSANAAQEIKQLISESSQRVRTGADRVEEAGNTMSQIVATTRKASELIQAIAVATQEQARSLSEITQASAQMEGVTQQNAGMVQEVATAAEHLEQEAAKLHNLMGQFKLSRSAAPSTTWLALR
ncbi:methyl-accepting chemotaxis protein [Curvibacter sp. CHRR-16]|uniref:methyl-accepting chemotaxis protein n=1 Tax=Curvibacter sp. CHRR-16 TaxID=2835872 RepID=UPI001BDA76FB|nr:methyl-accepting chemotaxis protein [Curvibacter sp. CHRR-16]